MKHERTKIRKIDLQRALAIRIAYEVKSGWGISQQTVEDVEKLFGNNTNRAYPQANDK